MTARSRTGRLSLALLLGGCMTACGSGSTSVGAASSQWLSRNQDEERLQLERQLRGFDVAMVETGYRYVELYWAARDANWDAAAHQVEKIRLAIENGLERRPKRAASAQPFLAGPLAATSEAVAARDAKRFEERFEALTAGCNACHALENVAFFEVRPPEHRVSPLRRERSAGAGG
jgi:hypothetical protein